jgi:DNA-binding response OmpR family regulator
MKILLFVLEDDERQIAAIRHVVKMEFPQADLRMAKDGQAAIDVLMGERILPDLAILDINTPRMNGLEVLEKLRSVSQFKYLPIIMFTTSDSEVDRACAMELGANGYVIKPPIRLMGSELRKIVDKYSSQIGQKPRLGDEWQELEGSHKSEAPIPGLTPWDDIESLLEGL